MIGCDPCYRRLAIWFDPCLTARGQTWKAGWVQALAGSNPASSANVMSQDIPDASNP
jgi:hypothetical protein